MEEGTTDSLLYIPFNPDRPPEHKTFDLAQDLGMSQNVAQLATHEKRIKDLGGVFFLLLGRGSEDLQSVFLPTEDLPSFPFHEVH
jgi:hypothetical protein